VREEGEGWGEPGWGGDAEGEGAELCKDGSFGRGAESAARAGKSCAVVLSEDLGERKDATHEFHRHPLQCQYPQTLDVTGQDRPNPAMRHPRASRPADLLQFARCGAITSRTLSVTSGDIYFPVSPIVNTASSNSQCHQHKERLTLHISGKLRKCAPVPSIQRGRCATISALGMMSDIRRRRTNWERNAAS
jgi:hypothetical protein